MPLTVNGIGTTYYGKKNAQTRQGECYACHRQTTLTSYDTKMWFVLLLVPIIPMGRKRIIDQCADCSRHHMMSQSEWAKLKEERDDKIDTYTRKPENPEFAKQALQAVMATCDPDALMALGSVIEERLGGDKDSLVLLVGCYAQFQKLEDIQRVMYRVVELDSDPKWRVLLGDTLLRLDKPDDAVPYLTHIIENQVAEDTDTLVLLGQVYQQQGRHEEASLAFDQAMEIVPELANNKAFTRMQRESAKRMGTDERVESHKIIQKAENADKFRRYSRIAAVVAILAAVVFSIVSISMSYRRSIYLVNGLPKPYTVNVNGESITLQPMSPRWLSVAEGDVSVTSDDPMVSFGPQTATITSSFFTRPFDQREFILNPDHAAILDHETVVYTSNNSSLEPVAPTSNYHCGQFFYCHGDGFKTLAFRRNL